MKAFEFRTRNSVTSTAPPDAVFDTVVDLRAHLEWSGDRAESETFTLLDLDAPEGPALVGTEFTSTGAADVGTFHDRSVIAEARRPSVFVIETDSRLVRKHRPTWESHFTHRYDIAPNGAGSTITYSERISRVNYVPFWLQWWARPFFRPFVTKADQKQLANLARLAEERAALS